MVASRQGVQDKVRETSVFSELVKLLPADLFRACLAQVSSRSNIVLLLLLGLECTVMSVTGKH